MESRLVIASLQGTLGLLVVWILCLALPRIPAAWRCWLWRLALLKMVVALFVALPISMPQKPVQTDSPVVHAFIRPAAPARAESGPAAVAAVVPDQPEATPIQWGLVAWVAGLSLVLGRGGLAWFRTWRILRRRPVVQDRLASSGVRTLAVEGLSVPGVLGVVRPTILLPADMGSASEEAVACAVAHELAHIRRRDVFWNLASEACRAIFWFHPLVWLACREQHAEAEIAADALARTWTGSSPRDYGHHMLHWLRPFPEVAAPGLLFSTHELTRRIKAMSITRYNRRSALALGAALAGPLTLVLIPATIVAGRLDNNGAHVTVPIPRGNGRMKEIINRPDEPGVTVVDKWDHANQRSKIAARKFGKWSSTGAKYIARLDDGRTVELVGITHPGPHHLSSWSPDGTPLLELLPFYPSDWSGNRFLVDRKGENWTGEPALAFNRQAIVRVSQPGIAGVKAEFKYPRTADQLYVSSNTMPIPGVKSDGTLSLVDQAFPRELKFADVVVTFFDPPKPMGSAKFVKGVAEGSGLPSASVDKWSAFHWNPSIQKYIEAKDGDSVVSITKPANPEDSIRVTVVDRKGREFRPFSLGQQLNKPGDSSRTTWLVRGVLPKDVVEVRYAVTKMWRVEFTGVHLHPSR